MKTAAKKARTFTVSLENKKPRGSGHERRAEILSAAKSLLLAGQADSVSTRRIAEIVGVSQTAVYVYFKNKDAILQAVVDEAFSKLSAVLAAIDERHPDAISYLREAIPAYVRFGLQHPDEYRLAFLVTLGDARLDVGESRGRSRVGHAVFQAMQARVVDGIRLGQLRAVGPDPTGVAQVLWAALHGLVSVVLAFPSMPWLETDALIAVQTEMILEGLCAFDAREARTSPARRP